MKRRDRIRRAYSNAHQAGFHLAKAIQAVKTMQMDISMRMKDGDPMAKPVPRSLINAAIKSEELLEELKELWNQKPSS